VPTSPAFVVFAVLLLATGLLRLVELRVSLGRIRRQPERLVAEPRLFPLMALLHAGFVFGPALEVLLLERPFLPLLAAAAAVVFAAAVALRVWTLRTIGRAWNVRIVRPADGEIATGGPYRFVRHPNYLAVILEIAALPLLHTAWLSCLTLSLLNGLVLFFRIRAEEAELLRVAAWREAMQDRARLLPGIF
jgi:methyltransferase